MEANHIHEEITRLLYKVEEQYSRIIQFNGNVPIIEVDLAIKDVQELYESFLDLRVASELQRRKSQQVPKNDIPVQDKIEQKPVVAEQKQEVPKVAVEDITKPSPELKTVESVATEINGVKKVESEVAAPEKKIENEGEKKIDSIIATLETSKATAQTLAEPPVQKLVNLVSTPPPVIVPKVDLLKEREKDFVPTVRKIEFKPEPTTSEPKKENIFEKAASLYDKIAKPTDKTVATAATRQPISNIKSSIGINEKFTFLKDLFKNNVNDYNEALDKLNNFDSYSDAEDYFQDLKSKYNWDSEGKSFQGLADLLNRRYLHNA